MARNKPRANAHLIGKIPDAPVELSERQQRVFAEKDKRRIKEDGSPVELRDLALEYGSLEEEEEFEDLARTERSVVFEALERRILEELEKVKGIAGTDMWRGEGQTFSPKHVLNVHVTDPQALRRWIKETDQEHILSVPAARLKSIVGEALNPELSSVMTPAERAKLTPGQPGSMQPPPGVSVSLHHTVNHTNSARKTRNASAPDADAPF